MGLRQVRGGLVRAGLVQRTHPGLELVGEMKRLRRAPTFAMPWLQKAVHDKMLIEKSTRVRSSDGAKAVAKAVGYTLGCPQDPKKERKKEMGHSRSQHFMLDSRDIESVTRRVGRWGFSKVYPWNGLIQPFESTRSRALRALHRLFSAAE